MSSMAVGGAWLSISTRNASRPSMLANQLSFSVLMTHHFAPIGSCLLDKVVVPAEFLVPLYVFLKTGFDRILRAITDQIPCFVDAQRPAERHQLVAFYVFTFQVREVLPHDVQELLDRA